MNKNKQANDNEIHADPQTGNEVGHGKPPKEWQFKKGASGNPTGRPKGVKSAASVFKAAFAQKVKMTKNGKPTKVPVIEALTTKVLSLALRGDIPAMKLAFALFKAAQPANDNQAVAGVSSFELTPDDWAAIEKSKLLAGFK
jgi:DNA-binding transcriptional regulator YdaS (Cro superfamily)